MPVGFGGVSNFAYTTSGQAFGVEADDQDAYGVVLVDAAITGALLAQDSDPLLTQSNLEIIVE